MLVSTRTGGGEDVDGMNAVVEEFIGEELLDNANFEEHFGENEREGEKDKGEDVDDESGDDMFDEEGIPDPLISDDEDAEEVIPDPREVLALWKTFNSANEFKDALLRYSLKTQYDIKLYTSTANKLSAKCTIDGCPWRVYCSYDKSKYKLMIKVFNAGHNCVRSGYTKMLKSTSIANLFEERLRLNPNFRPREMIVEVKREYNMIVTIDQCKRAKRILSERRNARHTTQFARVWDYQAEIISSNPGTTMVIDTIPGPTIGTLQRFNRLYVCFGALKESWKSFCRPIVGLDGAFLKWDIKGQLLAAVGRDGDNRIFSIAWAGVEVEDTDNWMWFLSLLRDDLGLIDGSNITIISDKQKGLLAAVKNLLLFAEHRMCARHILENWKRLHRNIVLERMFWKIARSYTMSEYADNLEKLRSYNPGAYESLMRQIPSPWS